jgi:DNA-binding XRE family transcriptional regulator
MIAMSTESKSATNKRSRLQTYARSSARVRAPIKKRPPLLEDPDPDLPPLPLADEQGHYPAIATARAIIARQLIRDRKAAGWTQAQLAARAGVRQETISRIETGKHSPGLKTMAKIDRVLKNRR